MIVIITALTIIIIGFPEFKVDQTTFGGQHPVLVHRGELKCGPQ